MTDDVAANRSGPAEEWATLRRLARLVRGQRGRVVLVAVLGLLAAAFEAAGLALLIPVAQIATGEAPDMILPALAPALQLLGFDLSGPDAAPVAVALVLIALVTGIAVGFLNTVLSNMLAMRFAHDLRCRAFGVTTGTQLGRIEALASGRVLNTIATVTWQTCDALFVCIRSVVQLTAVAVFAIVLVGLSPLFSAVLAAATAIMALAVHRATRAAHDAGAAAQSANQGFMAYLWDALGGLRVIRGFGRETHEQARFAARSDAVSRQFLRLKIISGMVTPLTQLMTIGMVALLLGIAVWRGEALSVLIGFLALTYRMQPRVAALLEARTQLRGLAPAIAEMEAMLALTDPELPAERRYDGIARGIELQDVTVHYQGSDALALESVSCRLSRGELVAVAGRSGAGKTTLVSLLLRFIAPDGGRILVDGTPLDQIAQRSWNDRVAFVEQNAFLFHATVRDNIAFGAPEAEIDAVVAAARAAQADGFIDALPDGYDTMIGGEGAAFSQGQRQRIALARAILRQPDLLILDEATNALDRPTEMALRATLHTGKADRITLVIAHRPETIALADRVIVLEEGRVIENGAPAQLALEDGAFARLYLDRTEAG